MHLCNLYCTLAFMPQVGSAYQLTIIIAVKKNISTHVIWDLRIYIYPGL